MGCQLLGRLRHNIGCIYSREPTIDELQNLDPIQ